MRFLVVLTIVLLIGGAAAGEQIGLPSGELALPATAALPAKDGPCAPEFLFCNNRTQSTIGKTGCSREGAYVRYYSFAGTEGNEVTLDVSSAFSAELRLFDPDGREVTRTAKPGTGVELTRELDRTGLWRLGVVGADPDQLGDFDLGIQCKGMCVASETAMCLSGGRFRVEVDWLDFKDRTGPARVVDFGSDDSGLFYFFNPDNWEMLVKVLDVCDKFDAFWVFSAATTSVEYTLTVTDTQTNATKEYFNPLGNAAAAITDTSAFATCP